MVWPRTTVWTAEMDATIRRMLAERATFPAIGAALGLAEHKVYWRAIATGMHVRRQKDDPQPQVPAQPAPAVAPTVEIRAPLPAGHPITWSVLSSAPYPRPVAP